MKPLWKCGQVALVLLCALYCIVLLASCNTQTVKSTETVPLTQAPTTLNEGELLDVGVRIFDSGIEQLLEDEDKLVFVEIRNAEAHYIPYRLMESLISSANWGAVRLIAADMDNVDLRVDGKIINSDGEVLELLITVHDASGRQWYSKTYKSMASKYSYEQRRKDNEPFRSLYNTIANELSQFRQNLSASDIQQIRIIAELKFAHSFSPDAFDKHLYINPDGIYQLKRLPSDLDPIMQRVKIIRERDYIFVDTLQEYYSVFANQMTAPYQEWRKQSYKEVVAYRELNSAGTRQLTAGVASIIGGIMAAGSGSGAARAAGQIGVVGGGYLIKSGMDRHEESKIHIGALSELGSSMEGEMSPQIIKLEERTVTLTGTVQNQYQQWRSILKNIYDADVGTAGSTPIKNN